MKTEVKGCLEGGAPLAKLIDVARFGQVRLGLLYHQNSIIKSVYSKVTNIYEYGIQNCLYIH